MNGSVRQCRDVAGLKYAKCVKLFHKKKKCLHAPFPARRDFIVSIHYLLSFRGRQTS